MKGRIVALGILSVVFMITMGFLISHLIGEIKTTFDETTHTWVAHESYKYVGKVLIEGVVIGLTAFASIVLSIVHLASNKEPEKGLNVAAGVLGIIVIGINWIICLITFIKLSGSGKKAQA